MLEVFKDDYQMFHSAFQIENFILIKNGKTTYGIYKQCLRELLSRESSLRSIYAQKMKQELDFEELEEKISKEVSVEGETIALRRLQIQRAEMAYGMKDILKVIKETEREYTHFYNAGVVLKEKLGDISGDKRETLEQELWVEQCKYKACSDIRMMKGISGETWGLVDSLPNIYKNDLSNFFKRIQGAQGQMELNIFIQEYSQNFEFGEKLDGKLPFEIKNLVENNGTRSQ